MKGIIKITEATLIALHCLAFLSKDKAPKNSTRVISEKLKISENHLSKVLQRLTKAGFVKSVRGPAGGFSLYKSSKDISLYDIYKTMEGELIVTDCLMDPNKCIFNECIIGNINKKLSKQFIDFFKNKKLSEYTNEE